MISHGNIFPAIKKKNIFNENGNVNKKLYLFQIVNFQFSWQANNKYVLLKQLLICINKYIYIHILKKVDTK
jgi:hypothetical protein